MQFIHNQSLNEVLNLVEEDVLGPRISYHSGSLHITDNFCAWRLEVCWQMSAESWPLWYQQCFVMRFQSQGLPLAWCFIENQSSVFSLWNTWCGLISKKTRFHFLLKSSLDSWVCLLGCHTGTEFWLSKEAEKGTSQQALQLMDLSESLHYNLIKCTFSWKQLPRDKENTSKWKVLFPTGVD